MPQVLFALAVANSIASLLSHGFLVLLYTFQLVLSAPERSVFGRSWPPTSVGRLAFCGRVARTSCSSLFKATYDEKIPLQKLTREERDEGAPHVVVARGARRLGDLLGWAAG